LTHERAATGARLDDPKELKCSQRFADGSARDLELLRELSLGGKLVARTEVALLEETLDLLDDALVKADPPDRLDDGQAQNLPESFWSGGQTRARLRLGRPVTAVNSTAADPHVFA
jgi:hypothetical protein